MRALPVLLVVVFLAACGGDGAPAGEPVDRWAAEICGSLDEWEGTITNRQRDLTASLGEIESLEDGKRSLLEFLDEALADTNEMLKEVEAAGSPAVEGGDALARELRSGLGRLRTAFEQAKTRAQQVDTDDPEAFQRDVTAVGEELTKQGEAIDETFDELDSEYDAPELDEAFEEEPACRDLTG